MPRIALWNLFLGFLVIFIGAAAGPFMVTDLTVAMIQDPQLLNQWGSIIQRSSHGHSSLFGLMQIAFGLTMPYSAWRQQKLRVAQTVGFIMGAIAMGPLMLLKSSTQPTLTGYGLLDIAIGICLSCTLLSLAAHAAGLGLKLRKDY